MFGHDDKDEDVTTINPTLDPNADAPAAPTDDPSVSDDSTASSAPTEPDNSAVSGSTDSDTSAPVVDDVVSDTPTAPASDESTPTTDVTDSNEDTTPSTSEPSHDSDSLLDLKKTALEELAPLVDKLDQDPEEKFKTTMMMIQATDDSSLIGKAHEAANQITDEKIRAQALLDVVNEINYFTQDSNK